MKKLLTFAAAAATLLMGAGAAQARDNVYWSIGIHAPAYPGSIGVNVGNAPRWSAPVYAPAPVYVVPAPVYVTPAPVYGPPPVVVYEPRYGHRRPSRDWRDHDRDGIPNWRDRRDDRDWRDRDRDGVPNWRDRRDDRWRD